MAVTGQGYRYAADILCEVSLHLLDDIVYTTISAFYLVGGWGTGGWGVYGWGTGPTTIQVASTNAMYVGAQIILGWGLTTQEVVTIIGITSTGYIFTTTPANSHAAGETILSPTFSYQQPTDPAFTQAEMLGYLSRAQNEYLSDCGCFYQMTQQNLRYGEIFQDTPATCIEVERMAVSQIFIEVATLARASNEVTCVTVNPHGLAVGITFTMQNSTAGFSGVFQIDSVPTPSSFTYSQIADDGTANGGAVLYFSRIYETTSAELTMTDRTWRNEFVGTPTSWFEDRAGLYRFGVGGKPASNFPIELLMSVRDTDTLGLLDGFIVPDVLAYILKWKVLAFAFSKDGIQQDPVRARYCESRYARGVAATKRFLNGLDLGLKAGSA